MRVGMNYWCTRAEFGMNLGFRGLSRSIKLLEQNTKWFIQKKIIYPERRWKVNFRSNILTENNELLEIAYSVETPELRFVPHRNGLRALFSKLVLLHMMLATDVGDKIWLSPASSIFQRLHRCRWRMLETKCVGEKFEMLVTDLGCWWPI